MDEDVSPDYCIVAIIGREAVNVGLFEFYVVVAGGTDASSRDVKRCAVNVEGAEVAMRTHKARGDQGDLADAAPQFKNVHAS
jgi:hypothetical protein